MCANAVCCQLLTIFISWINSHVIWRKFWYHYEMMIKNLGSVWTVPTNGLKYGWRINLAIKIIFIFAELISCLAVNFILFVEAVFRNLKFEGLSFCIKWGELVEQVQCFPYCFILILLRTRLVRLLLYMSTFTMFLWWNTLGKSVWMPSDWWPSDFV